MERPCVVCVDSYITRYHWSLISRDALLARVEREYLSRGGDGADAARAAVLWCYSAIMHRACSGADGRRCQEQGYSELYAFLIASAKRRYAHVGAEAIQRAAERIYVDFTQCRQPETFLAFALQKLRDAARAELRCELRAAESLPEGDSTLASVHPMTLADARSDPADVAIRSDFLQHIRCCAKHFMQKYPRASQQFIALWMRHIEGLDDEMIGQRLGTSGAAVQVMRSRAARRLRRDPDWQRLAYDLGVLTGGTPSG